MSHKVLIETIHIRDKSYIDMIALSLHLRDMASKETNDDIKKYMNFLSDELLRMLVKKDEK
jgi:hypothetical protein